MLSPPRFREIGKGLQHDRKRCHPDRARSQAGDRRIHIQQPAWMLRSPRFRETGEGTQHDKVVLYSQNKESHRKTPQTNENDDDAVLYHIATNGL